MYKEAEIILITPNMNDEKKNLVIKLAHGSVDITKIYFFHTEDSMKFSIRDLERVFKGKTIHQILADPKALEGTKVRYKKTLRDNYKDIDIQPVSEGYTEIQISQFLS